MLSSNQHTKDIEDKRSIFFLLGISIALLAAIGVMQWETELKTELSEIDCCLPNFLSPQTPVTHQSSPERPVPPKTSDFNINLLLIGEPAIDPESNLKLNTTALNISKDLEDDLDPIEELQYNEDIEPIEAVLIDYIAAPQECSLLKGRQERIDCFNQWLSKYMKANTAYPEMERSLGMEGTVYMSFVIDENGQVAEVSVLRSPSPGFAKEATSVLKKLPQMEAGKHKGKPARMKMVFPISFEI